jgi:hypothetical protein
MSKPSRVFRLGVLADLHVGSRYALVPPAFRGDPGPAGMFLDYMWSCWLDFVQKCPPLDCLIINGDSMEGEHPTLRSAPDAIDTSPVRQVDMAVDTLGLIRPKAKKLWLVRGTGFHEGLWNQSLEQLGRELHAEKWTDRRYSGEVLEGTFAGHTLNVCHAQTFGAIYQGTLLDRTARFAALADSVCKSVEADLIIRSHTHQTGLGCFQGKWVLSTRCWKLLNPHAISRMEYYRALSSLGLGGHVITFSEDGITWRDFKYEPYKPDAVRKLA